MRVASARWMRATILLVTSFTFFLVLAAMLVAPARKGAALTTDAIIATGLLVWRKPDAQGAACANCHGPDGFEIARFNFSDRDIRRRGMTHVPQTDVNKIVAMIHAVREKYGLNGKLLDPLNDRPFQPGGEVVLGATPLERDYNTALQTFAPKLPALFKGRVDSILKALQARDEVLAFDLRNEKIGVPFPRLSEDIAHGKEHGSMNDWFTEWPRLPKLGHQAPWYALQDAYLANPTEANLWAVYHAVDSYTSGIANASEDVNALATAKFKSLLLGQHLMREEALGQNVTSSQPPMAFLEIPFKPGKKTEIHNPMFTVSSLTLENHLQVSDFSALGLNDLNSNLDAQFKQMTLPWWFMAWTFDPSLTNASAHHEDLPKSVESYFSDEAYPIHRQFVHIKMALTQAYSPYVRVTGQPPQVNALDLTDAAQGFDYPDSDAAAMFLGAAHRQAYRSFMANVRRMQLYLLLNELNKQCADDRPYVDMVGEEVNFVEGLRAELLPELARIEPSYAPQNRALVDEVIRRLPEAWNHCKPLPRAGHGFGLRAEQFDDSDLSSPLGTRIDPRLNFLDATDATVVPNVGSAISIQWTGELEPRFSDVYQISVRGSRQASSGFRLWIDGRLLLDNWNGPLVKGKVISQTGDDHFGLDVALQTGKRHALRLEYRGRGAKQSIQLMWQSAHQMPEIIPQSQLYPGRPLSTLASAAIEAR